MKFYHLFYLVIIFLLSSCSQTKKEEKLTVVQEEILSYKEIDSVYDSFTKVKYKDLPTEYIEYTGLNGKYSATHRDKEFLVIRKEDQYKYLLGHFPVWCFLPRDQYFYNEKSLPEKIQYLLIDKTLLYRISDLIHALKKRKLNSNGFYVRESFRHPTWNDERGGAKNSQHIYGTAVDLVIMDINKDGKADEKDKNIVLEILEDEIIGNNGGIGRYPGTHTIHIDLRGYRARWDHMKKKNS